MTVDLSLTAKVLQALRWQGGVMSSAHLQKQLGVSQPTVSRALAPLIQSGQVLKVGAARSQRYVLPRKLAGLGRELAVMRIDAMGQASPFARLVPLQGGAIWVDEADGLSQKHGGLPWFLDDMRPQGFMGRTFAHAHPELQLGSDPRHWSDDDVLRALALFGDDLPGNLVVGEAAFQRFQTRTQRASHASSAQDYPRMAEQAMQGTLSGSSAGGEQPKFCTVRDGQHVIVKFSPGTDAPTDQRLRDLLVCEHLALQTLSQAGLPAAHTTLHSGAGRVFLEAHRFDRTAQGRIGMVSLMVYDAEYVGEMDNWAATAQRMAARGLLSAKDARTLCLLEAYGVLIANTDRHYGNISLILENDDWTLSPTYDMLPMLYAPVGGELVARDFTARGLRPTTATLPEWARAKALARQFWHRVGHEPRISSGFRELALQNLCHLDD